MIRIFRNNETTQYKLPIGALPELAMPTLQGGWVFTVKLPEPETETVKVQFDRLKNQLKVVLGFEVSKRYTIFIQNNQDDRALEMIAESLRKAGQQLITEEPSHRKIRDLHPL